MPLESKRRVMFTKDAKFTLTRVSRLKPRKIAVQFLNSAGEQVSAQADVEQPESIATLSGYACIWNTLSDDRGGYQVRLLPGSASFTTPAHALFHHDFQNVIGTTANGSLRILPDDVGVKVEIDLPDTSCGRDVEELVENGYVGGMSFAMVDAPTFTMKTEGPDKQQIMEVSAFTCDEVTVTAIPSFTDTSIQVVKDEVPEGEGMQAASIRNAQALQLEQFKLRIIEL